MKKFLAIAACAAIGASVFAFAGCGGKSGSEYAVDGDYKQATAEDINGIVNGGVSFGDATAENYMLGLEVKANLEASESVSGVMSASGKLGLNYLYNRTATEIKGVGDASVEYSATYGEQKLEGKYSVKTYNDGENAYASVSGLEALGIAGGVASGYVRYWDIIEAAAGLIPASLSAVTAESEPGMSDILTIAAEYKLGVFVDSSDGYKVKLSVTEDTVLALIDSFVEDETAATTVKEALTINKFVFDAYFVVDSEGVFKQLALDVNIDVKTKAITMGEVSVDEASVTLKGGVSVRLTDAVVDLSGLNKADYTVDYTDIVVELINGIGNTEPDDPEIGYNPVS